MPRISFYNGPLGTGNMAMPPVQPNDNQFVSSLATGLGTMAGNAYLQYRQGQPDPNDPTTAQSAASGAVPTAAVAPGADGPVSAATPASSPAQAARPSLGQTLGTIAKGALFGTSIGNPQRQGQNLMDRANANKINTETALTKEGEARLQAATAENQITLAGVREQAAALRQNPDPVARAQGSKQLLADFLTKIYATADHYRIDKAHFSLGVQGMVNLLDPTGEFSMGLGTALNGPEKQGESYTEAESQGALADSRQTAHLASIDKTAEGVAVQNAQGAWELPKARISADATVKSAGIGAGATIGAAKINQAGETGRTMANLAVNAPLRQAQTAEANTAAQGHLAAGISTLLTNAGVPAQDVPVVAGRAARYMQDGMPMANAVAKARADLTVPYSGQSTLAPYASPPGRIQMPTAAQAAPAAAGKPRVRQYDPATGTIH